MTGSFFIRRRPLHLLLAWCAYWVGLIALKLGPAIIAGWQMSEGNDHGSVNAGVTDGIVSANISEAGRTVWTGSISLTHLTMLVAIPPLVLWIVWLIGSSRTNNAGVTAPRNETGQRELKATEPRIGIIDTTSSSPSKRRAREES